MYDGRANPCAGSGPRVRLPASHSATSSIFVTGGVAVADVQYGVGVDGYGTARQSGTQVGWTGGGGFEIGLGVISFRGEFLHFDLGDETVTNGMNGNSLTSSTFENTGDTFRFAINFRLN